MTLEPDQIFELVVEADEKLKYADVAHAGKRLEQAAQLLARALEQARSLGNEGLISQVELRLEDLRKLKEESEK